MSDMGCISNGQPFVRNNSQEMEAQFGTSCKRAPIFLQNHRLAIEFPELIELPPHQKHSMKLFQLDSLQKV